MNLDMGKLEPLLGKVVNELGAVSNGALVILGDRLGLFRALALGKANAAELARRTGTHERHVREWLCAQAASGFIDYDKDADCFSMSPEQAAVFADADSPVLMTGGFNLMAAIYHDEPKLADAFRAGKGLHMDDHAGCLACGIARFFEPGYRAHLIGEWLPSLDGAVEKLERGARVADIGCGHGISTRLMAKAFPKSQFVGIDYHEASIAAARKDAKDYANIRFEVGRAQDFAGDGFDLVTMFDALHDMGDPVGAAAQARRVLKDDGTLMLVEPAAGDSLADNLNPVGRVYYAGSTHICVPTALNQDGGRALGAQAGETRIGEVVREGGFTRFRKVSGTPFNMILEARP